MGHYDSAYEYDAEERYRKKRQRILEKATAMNIPVLEDSNLDHLKPRGICQQCEHVVFYIPNFLCNSPSCPHKP